MNADDINKYIIANMRLAEEQDDDAVVRFYLSNDDFLRRRLYCV